MSSLTQDAIDRTKELAPWRTNLPWWVLLIEGIVLGIVGVLILLDPSQTTTNIALFLTAVLAVAGALQLWSILRGKAPDTLSNLTSARGAIALFVGLIVLLMYFLRVLTLDTGQIVFGSGSLIYGLLGFWIALRTSGAHRRTALLEAIFFTAVGGLMIYVLFMGPESVTTATTAMGWIAIAAGLGMVGVAFLRRSRHDDVEEGGEENAARAQDAAATSPDAPVAPKETRAAPGGLSDVTPSDASAPPPSSPKSGNDA